jgi:uncharacterized protein YukE
MGLDPEQVNATRTVFVTQADAVTELTTRLTNEVQNNIGAGRPAWEGPRADQFVNTWNGEFKPALDKLRQALDEAIKELESVRQQAEGVLGS